LAQGHNPYTHTHSMLSLIRNARIAPAAFGAATRNMACSVQPSPLAAASSLVNTDNMFRANPLAQPLAVRHAGASVLGCGIGLVAIGGCAGGIGQLFGALVVGIARNPSMKEDLFTYTLVGIGFIELLAIIVILFSIMLLYSE